MCWHFYLFCAYIRVLIFLMIFLYPRSPKGEGGMLFYLCPSVLPSVQDIFRRIFLSNCWWQKSDIWSQASYRYTILWVAFFVHIFCIFVLIFLYVFFVFFHLFLGYFTDIKHLTKELFLRYIEIFLIDVECFST